MDTSRIALGKDQFMMTTLINTQIEHVEGIQIESNLNPSIDHTKNIYYATQ